VSSTTIGPYLTSRLAAIAAAATIALTLAASPALAAQPITSFTTTTSETQAGGHPDFTTSFTLDSPGAPESARNVIFNAPEGLFGNPDAVTKCTPSDFALQQCPSNSQVGLITIYANYKTPNDLLGTAPIFDMAPGADQTALFAFIVPTLQIPINIPVAVRTGTDYGLRFTVSEITQTMPLAGASLTFWGFPADGVNNAERFPKGSPGKPAGCPELANAGCNAATPVKSSIGVQPLTDNPTTCTGQPLPTTLEVRTYQDPGATSRTDGEYPATTGCEKEIFRPVLYMTPTTTEADAPSGLNIELANSQFLNHSVSPSEIRSAIVTLPPGLTINPDAADGQTSCSDLEANFGSEAPASCPDKSKIGTFSLHTVALPGDLPGAIFIGQPQPGNQYRLFLVADGFGVHAKLEASVRPDPVTGKVTVHIEDLPQVPFDDIQLHLFASDRGLMATPTHCTLYPVSARFFPWNATLPDQTSTQFFSVESGPGGAQCPAAERPFHPRLAAGTSNPTAGAFSDFTLKLDRDDGDQFLGDLNFRMPPGFTGSLRGLSYCPEAAIAAAALNSGRSERATPSCPASSQVGTTNVAAGPGSHPFHAVGRMYLAGPLKGAPLSLVAVTPALAGPFDYGVVVVRVALHVDPLTAQVTAASDTVPSIIGGVPIRMRSIQVNIDKPGFTINPTNCSALSVDSQGIGDQGTVAAFSSYFHAVNCRALAFKPTMKITQLGGRKATKRNQDPSMRFDLNTRAGDANIKAVAVTLPKAFAIDQRHLGNICSRAELAAKHCEGRQAIGTVSTETPLLDQPLTGPAYAVSGFGKLPHLAFVLRGQVTIIPEAESSSVKGGHLKTVVPTVPDVPIGHFRLTLFGGKQGYLVNTRDLCGAASVTTVEYAAQNGVKRTEKVRTKAACGSKAARHARRG